MSDAFVTGIEVDLSRGRNIHMRFPTDVGILLVGMFMPSRQR